MNGLLDQVPPEWNCDEFYRRDEKVEETLRRLQNQSLDVAVGDESVINIVLVGLTGAGKSYFGNGLLGSTDPGSDSKLTRVFCHCISSCRENGPRRPKRVFYSFLHKLYTFYTYYIVSA